MGLNRLFKCSRAAVLAVRLNSWMSEQNVRSSRWMFVRKENKKTQIICLKRQKDVQQSLSAARNHRTGAGTHPSGSPGGP